jgi:molecular chaperone GrpE
LAIGDFEKLLEVTVVDNTQGEEPQTEDKVEANGAAAGTEGAATAEAQNGEAELAGELKAARQALVEEKDKHLRLLAEFDNFKRRTLKEQSELLKYQGEKVVVDLLEVLDTLELALTYTAVEHDKLKQGLEMTQKLFVERLGRWGIKGESGVGQMFDPQKHAAISRIPASEGTPPGTIAAELKRAYFYKDKLIRPGEVVVAAEA